MDIHEINKKIIDYPYTLRVYLDHLNFLSWFQYMGHKCATLPKEGKIVKNVNFDDRVYIDMPSGAKVRITITIENITTEAKDWIEYCNKNGVSYQTTDQEVINKWRLMK